MRPAVARARGGSHSCRVLSGPEFQSCRTRVAPARSTRPAPRGAGEGSSSSGRGAPAREDASPAIQGTLVLSATFPPACPCSFLPSLSSVLSPSSAFGRISPSLAFHPSLHFSPLKTCRSLLCAQTCFRWRPRRLLRAALSLPGAGHVGSALPSPPSPPVLGASALSGGRVPRVADVPRWLLASRAPLSSAKPEMTTRARVCSEGL